MNEKLRASLARMDDLPDEELAALLDVERQEAGFHRELAQAAEASFLRRLAERDAKEVLAGEYVVCREDPRDRIEWDIPDLQQAAGEWLTDQEQDEIMWEVEQAPRWHVESRRVLALANKRGPEFKRLVDAAMTRVPAGTSSITLRKNK